MDSEEVQIHFDDNKTTVHYGVETFRVIRGHVMVFANNKMEKRSVDIRDPSVQKDMEKFHDFVQAVRPRPTLDIIIKYTRDEDVTIAGHHNVYLLFLKFDRRGIGISSDLVHTRGYY